MNTGVIGGVFGFGLTFEELRKNKIPDKHIYAIINNFESENNIMYDMRYIIKEKKPYSLLAGQNNKHNKEDFESVENIIEKNTPLKIPSEYLKDKKGLSKRIPIPENLKKNQVLRWIEEYFEEFKRFQLNVLYIDLPEYYLKTSGLPEHKLTSGSLGIPLH